MRRVAALSGLALLLGGACVTGARPALQEDATGVVVRGTQIESSSTNAPVTPGPAGDVHGTSAGPGQGSYDPDAALAAEDAARRDAAARAAVAPLDQYLTALGRGDHAAAQAHASGGPWLLALLRDLQATGGGRTPSLESAAFDVVGAEQAAVHFRGTATLAERVFGADGNAITRRTTIGDPTVRYVSGAWKVTELAYGGRPLLWFPPGGSGIAGAVQVRLVGGLAIGDRIAVVLELASDDDHHVRIDDSRLRFPDGTEDLAAGREMLESDSTFVHETYDRRDDLAPSRWVAEVRVDDDPTQLVEIRF